MSSCKYCGCLGWFFSLSEAGLCHNCHHLVHLEIEQSKDAIRNSRSLADQTLNPHSKLAKLEIILKNLEALAKYEKHGIPTLQEGSPSLMLEQGQRTRDEIILDTARAEMESSLPQIQAAEGSEKKLACYNRFLLKIQEYKSKLRDPRLLEPMESKLKNTLHQIHLNAYLEKARQAELAAQLGRAREHYREALAFLQHEDIDPKLRAEQQPKIESKLRGLPEN